MLWSGDGYWLDGPFKVEADDLEEAIEELVAGLFRSGDVWRYCIDAAEYERICLDMKKFKEITTDRGVPQTRYASDNNADYILTSAYMKDLYRDYVERYNRFPAARWYRRHASFRTLK